MKYSEARDVIFGIFKNSWDAKYPVVWTDVNDSVPTDTTHWARVVLRHNSGRQTSLTNESGCVRYNRRGYLYVQIFSPIAMGHGAGYELAQSVTTAFQKAKHPTVWFRRVFITEVGQDGAFQQINVSVAFEYDEVI